LILQRAAERDLGRCHQTEVHSGNGIDLSLITAGLISGSLQNLHAGEIRSGVQCESMLHQLLNGVLGESQLQQDRFVLEEVESTSCHAGSGLKIDQIVLLG
jgi:hypothetical protein